MPNNTAPAQNTPPVSIETEPDIADLSNKKSSKKKKIAKISLISAAVIGIGIASAAAFRHNGGVINTFKKFIRDIKKHPQPSSETIQDLQKGANNVTNSKDSVSRHFMMKIPGYERFDNFISNKYRQTATNATQKGWYKARKHFTLTERNIRRALKHSQIDEGKASRIKELLSKRRSMLNMAAEANGVQNRVSEVDKALNRLDIDAWNKITELRQTGLKGLRKLSTEALAEERINQAKGIQDRILKPLLDSDLTPDELSELKTLLKELQSIQPKDSKNFMNDFIQSNWYVKRAKVKEGKDLFEKLRDINHGSGPTDIMGMAGTAALLGIYTAQADSKDEKIGVTLTTGIPLIATLATTLVATNKMISGAKAMGLGLLTGFIANKIGNKVNNKYKEHNNIEQTEKTIVTLDDYLDKVADAGESIATTIGF